MSAPVLVVAGDEQPDLFGNDLGRLVGAATGTRAVITPDPRGPKTVATALLAPLRAAATSGVTTVIATGPVGQQRAVQRAIDISGVRHQVHLCCHLAADHPPPSGEMRRLVAGADSVVPFTDAGRRALSGLGAHVWDPVTPPLPAFEADRPPGTGSVVAHYAQTASDGADMAVRIFHATVGGHHHRCGHCRATSLDRFVAEDARYMSPDVCVRCGAERTEHGQSRPRDRLALYLARSTPDDLLALIDQLGVGGAVRISNGGPVAVGACDVVLAPHTGREWVPAIAAARAYGIPSVSTDTGTGPPGCVPPITWLTGPDDAMQARIDPTRAVADLAAALDVATARSVRHRRESAAEGSAHARSLAAFETGWAAVARRLGVRG